MSDAPPQIERHLPALALAELAARLGGPLLMMLAMRFLTPGVFGAFTLLFSILTLWQLVVGLGLGKALIQQTEVGVGALSTYLIFVAGLGTAVWLLTGVLFLFNPFTLGEYLQPVHVFCLALIVPVGALVSLLEAFLQRQHRFREFANYRILTGLFPGAVTFVGAWAGFGIWSLIGASVGSSVLQLLFLWAKLHGLGSIRFQWAQLRPNLRFGSWTLGESLTGWAFSWTDTLAVAYFLGAPAAGAYKMAWLILDVSFSCITAPVATASYPAFCRLVSQPAALLETFTRMLGLTAALTLPLGLFYFLTGFQVSAIVLGPAWQDTGLTLCWIGLCYGTVGLTALNSEIFRACGQPQLSLTFGAISLVSYLPVYFILCPLGLWPLLCGRMGITVWGTFWNLYLLRRVLPELAGIARLTLGLLGSLVGTLLVALGGLYLLPPLPPVAHLLASGGLVFGVFALSLWRFHPATWESLTAFLRAFVPGMGRLPAPDVPGQ